MRVTHLQDQDSNEKCIDSTVGGGLFTRQSGRNKIRRDVGFVYCEAGHTISKSRDIESMHCAKIGTFVVGAFFVSCMGNGVAIAVGG